MRVLVTGGTGYLGHAVVERLAAHGHVPVVFARGRTAGTSLEPPTGVETIEGDVRDADALARAVSRCEAVCHLAALVSVWQPRPLLFDEVNVGGVRHVIAAVERAGTGRLVCASSFLARPPLGRSTPITGNDYLRTKVAADLVLSDAIARGLPLVRLYPGVVYGPGPATEGNLVGRLVRDHLGGRLPGLIGADRQWSFAFVSDVADAFVAAVERATPGSSYVVGGTNAPQMRVFEIVRDLTGRRLPRRIPNRLAAIVGAVDEMRARLVRRPPLLTRGVVEIFRQDWPLDSSAATRDLNYRVRPLQEGVEALVRAL